LLVLLAVSSMPAEGIQKCAGSQCTEHHKCVSWRQTGGCNPKGKREPKGDRRCQNEVPKDASGYCECGGGVRVRSVGCGHETFKCDKECAMQERYKCVGWRQTGDCSANGPRESEKDRDCDLEVDPGSSGYCECGAGRLIKRSGCKKDADADAFTCSEECAAAVSHYEILGLEREAAMPLVKKAFRVLSLKYHPDKNSNNETAKMLFAEVREAYDVLGDKSKKQLYDMGGDMTAPDGKQLQKANLMRGNLQVPLEHFYNGNTMKTSMQRKIICRGCGDGKQSKRCNKCTLQCPNEIRTVQVRMGPMLMNQQQEVRSSEKCKNEQTQLEVTVEKGMKAGSEVNFPVMGEQRPGMIPGDLVMVLQQAPHKTFTWRNDDLFMTMTVTLKQALLGFKKEVKHMDGRTIFVEQHNVVSPDQVIILRGEGMPKQIPTEKGNLHVTMKIEMPTKIADGGLRKFLQEHLPEK